MDHNTLFPVLEMGFSFWDILMKPEICAGCSYWYMKFPDILPEIILTHQSNTYNLIRY